MENFRFWYFEKFGWLFTNIYENPILYFDLWSPVQLWSGFMFYLLLILYKTRKPLLILLSAFLLFDLLETFLGYFLFQQSGSIRFNEIFSDLLLASAGGMIARYSVLKMIEKDPYETGKYIKTFTVLFTSITVAFTWVGFYGYKYNVGFWNSPGLNFTAFLLWFSGQIAIISISLYIYSRIKKVIASLFLIYIIYLPALSLFEYFNYHIIKVREVGTPFRRALFFDIIHGTTILHFFYVLAPVTGILVFLLFLNYFNKIIQECKKDKVAISG
ncbi:MAG TPA: hypothetical protein PLZ15_02330 [Melioribacteraceae bacterium]|nr:hypothetical protein [Melioribacteraceae bacterium]